jgi:hypothetical protein
MNKTMNKLQEYVDGEKDYTKIMNYFFNNRDKNWMDELGKYIADTIDISKDPSLSFFADKLPKKNIITKINIFNNSDHIYNSIAIFFLTASLGPKELIELFGKPIYHDHFGEGFDRKDRFRGKKKETYASFFVNINGLDFHIGFDHRGTGIEVEAHEGFYRGTKTPTAKVQECLDALKKLVDMYKEKCC